MVCGYEMGGWACEVFVKVSSRVTVRAETDAHGRQEETMDVSEAFKAPSRSSADASNGPARTTQQSRGRGRGRCWNPAALLWLVLGHRTCRKS